MGWQGGARQVDCYSLASSRSSRDSFHVYVFEFVFCYLPVSKDPLGFSEDSFHVRDDSLAFSEVQAVPSTIYGGFPAILEPLLRSSLSTNPQPIH